ncbi:MAG TPA: aminotransferase class I/II-fold pyridoxal phosphate-dependent enzyme [Polyangiaceae bacterium]|jgi:DNA-binding transcriptional MocR family regulator|nr:aminotransferase class I/II-fold pyridoxal phosphate-dependent enzyme [Polyangiaceae bacterium]
MPSPDLDKLKASTDDIERRYAALRDRRLALDMTRGKPCPEQLDLSNELLTILTAGDYRAADGTDCRNYGGLDGLPESKALFAEFLEVSPKEILVGDNSSLTLLHDTIARAVSHGVPGGNGPWSQGPVKFVCPVPGYDRHFAICEHFGVEMVNVELLPDGPDMDRLEAMVGSDPSVKGMWLVPKYANPSGATCSDAVVERLATMRTAAPDFRILWDNAYAHHHLTDSPPALANILEACKRAGNPERVFIYGSTSKITFAGAGMAVMAASEKNVAWMKLHRSRSTIGPDKLNELRHARFFRNMEGVRAHMKKHAELLKPKFEAVERVLRRELGDGGLATFTKPFGGYFVSLDTMDGCAKSVVKMAAEVGVKLTEAGATFPYGKDPRDRNIRIAPTLPKLAEIEAAMEVLAVCVQRASLQKFGA